MYRTIFFLNICMLLSCSSNAQDWAQLDRFKSQNEALMNDLEYKNGIVFMGNSITEGWLNDSLNFFDRPGYINRGIGGQTTSQMKIRFWQDVISLQPKAVVILAGINDIAQNTGYIAIPDIAQNIKDMAILASNQKIKVFICSVLPANNFPWRPQIDPSDKVIELNKLLKQYASEAGHIYVDYYTPMANDKKGLKEKYTYDGVHCTIAGYQAMEKILDGYFSEAFSSNKR